MTFYLYIQPDGTPDVSTYPLRMEAFPGYQFMGEFEEEPDVKSKRWVDGQWVSADSRPEYVVARVSQYPAIGDQLDALWHAMHNNTLPRVEPFYSDILAVKQANPKPSN